MLTIAALILGLAALGQVHSMDAKKKIYPLDMAQDSVDDQFKDCTKDMERQVQTYLKHEISANIFDFGKAWEDTEKKPRDGLTENHLIAITVYTGPRVFGNFNAATRTGKNNYTNNKYGWYSLYFLLTEAIQILKKTQTECKTTYRGTTLTFDENVLKKEIRFGQFASSSTNRTVAQGYGNESCFEIKTCEGAEVTEYSMDHTEKEVLIPPYEKFKITDVSKDKWCKTVFKLENAGTRSDLNCAVAKLET